MKRGRRGAWLLLATLSACAHAPASPPPPADAAPPVAAPRDVVAPVSGPEADARAEAAFRALEPRFDALDAMRFDEPKRLKAAMTERIRAQQQLEQGYRAILQLGSAHWSAAALVRLGDMDEGLGQLLRDAALPPGLTPEQAELFRAQLVTLARPAEQKALASYLRAIDLEEESARPSQWGAFAREQVTQLKAREP